METLLIVILIIFIIFPILIANILALRSRRTELLIFDAFLFLLNVPVFLIGLIFWALPSTDLKEVFSSSGFSLSNPTQIAIIL